MSEQNNVSERVVTLGSHVTIEYNDGDTETFLLRSGDEQDYDSRYAYSIQSALGKAVLNKCLNTPVAWETPSGAKIIATITSIEQSEDHGV